VWQMVRVDVDGSPTRAYEPSWRIHWSGDGESDPRLSGRQVLAAAPFA
jgi:hypothetical protein